MENIIKNNTNSIPFLLFSICFSIKLYSISCNYVINNIFIFYKIFYIWNNNY